MSYDGRRIAGVIPSRIDSSRLPRKALADIHGLPMVVHVLKRAQLSPVLDDLIVATDSPEIRDVVEEHGGRAVMTSSSHTTGIERTAEAVRDLDCDVVVLINGDEAALNPEHIEVSVRTLCASDAPTSLLASPFSERGSTSDFKVVVNRRGEAMYFSREDIPSPSRSGEARFLKAYHIISFKKPFLAEYVALERTPLESIEGHDHLRMLEHCVKVQVGVVEHASASVDTDEDLERVRAAMVDDPVFARYYAD